MASQFVLKARLKYDQEFMLRCLVKVYEQQELDEQDARLTCHSNGKGFNKADGTVLSAYAEKIISGHPLTPSELEDATDRMLKYSNQLQDLLDQENLE